MALLDVIDEEAEVPALQANIAAATDPAELVRAVVKLTRQMNERCGDIIRALASAAPVDPDAAAGLAEGERRHRDGTAGSPAGSTGSGRCARGLRRGRRRAVQPAHLTARLRRARRERGWSYDTGRGVDRADAHGAAAARQRSAIVKPPGSTRARTREPRCVERRASRPPES